MMGRKALLVFGSVAAILVAGTASVAQANMRYCERPGGPGNFISATPNVKCSTAFHVVHQIFSPACWNSNRCYTRGFVCLSYWNGSFSHPFSFSHHGFCTASGGRKIRFDFG